MIESLVILGILFLILLLCGIVLIKTWKDEVQMGKRRIKGVPRGKYEWRICPHCHLAYIPYKKNQMYCSYWCEFLEHTKG